MRQYREGTNDIEGAVEDEAGSEPAAEPERVPGRRTLTERLGVFRSKAAPGRTPRPLAAGPHSAGGGVPLPANTRTTLERAFGQNLGGVRIHIGEYAARLANAADSLAITHGNDIYFALGAYSPDSHAGFELLAHEVHHTLQAPAKWGDDAAGAEAEADAAAHRATVQRDAEIVASELGPKLGLDSGVAISTDAESQAQIQGRGGRGLFSNGSVHLDAMRVQPSSPDGRQVVAHELVHAAQARLPGARDDTKRDAEAEARAAATALAGGSTPPRIDVPLRADARAGDTDDGGEYADVVSAHAIVVANDEGKWITWNVRLTVKDGPADPGADEHYDSFEGAAVDGIREAIEGVSDETFAKTRLSLTLGYRRLRDRDQVQKDARKKAAKKLAKLKRTAKAPAASKETAEETVTVEAPRNEQQSERESAIQAIVAYLRPYRKMGAQVQLSFYVNDKACTLVATKRIAEGGTDDVERPGLAALAAQLRELTTSFAGTPRYVNLTYELGQTGWVGISMDTNAPGGRTDAAPPEARTIALAQTSYNAEAKAAATAAAKEITAYAIVPGTLDVTVTLQDDRLVRTYPGTAQAKGANAANVAHGDRALRSISEAILPYTRGHGERTIRFGYEITVDKNNEAVWTVISSGTERPQNDDYEDEGEAIVREYRGTHERIIAEWRQGVKDAGKMAARMAAEEVAVSMVAGGLGKALGWAAGKILPRLAKLFAKKTKKQQKEWLETALRRLPEDERDEAVELMFKAETKGLSKAEKATLAKLEERLADLAEEPLSRGEKKRLREAARSRMRKAKAEVFEDFAKAGIDDPPVHHKVGLEYAHLFPEKDINSVDNLTVLHKNVHDRISAVWTRFRSEASGKTVTRDSVEKVARSIDTEFAEWYDEVVDDDVIEALSEAESRALTVAEKAAKKL